MRKLYVASVAAAGVLALSGVAIATGSGNAQNENHGHNCIKVDNELRLATDQKKKCWPTPSPSVSATPSVTPTPSPSVSPTPTVTPVPSATPTTTPVEMPIMLPSVGGHGTVEQ